MKEANEIKSDDEEDDAVSDQPAHDATQSKVLHPRLASSNAIVTQPHHHKGASSGSGGSGRHVFQWGSTRSTTETAEERAMREKRELEAKRLFKETQQRNQAVGL